MLDKIKYYYDKGMLDKIKYYYDKGMWDINRVWNVVGRALNAEEYKEITGFEYPDKN